MKSLSKPEIQTAIQRLWEDTKSSVSLYKKTENRQKAQALRDAALALNAKNIACQAGLLLCLIERDITLAIPATPKRETGRGHKKSVSIGETLSLKSLSKMRTAYGNFSEEDLLKTGEKMIDQGAVPTREGFKKMWIKKKIADFKMRLQSTPGQPGAFLLNQDISNFQWSLKQMISPVPMPGCEPDLYRGFDFVITDPPYEKQGIHLYEKLSLFGAHLLKPGGSLICLSGSHFFNKSLENLCKHLSYHWTLSYDVSAGPSARDYAQKTYQQWKPLIWMTKGKYCGPWIADRILCPPRADSPNEIHKWQQAEKPFEMIIERFCKGRPVSIIDPFMGSGTTGAAAMKLGHKFFGSDIDRDSYCVARGRLISFESHSRSKPDFSLSD